MIEYIERQGFNELIISTPGTMGLTALAAARLLGLRTTGIYHTDFPEYVRRLTRDDELADMTWKYMLWFYEHTDRILVPTEHYRKDLIHHGFEPAQLEVMEQLGGESRGPGLGNAEESGWQRVLEGLWNRDEKNGKPEETQFADSSRLLLCARRHVDGTRLNGRLNRPGAAISLPARRRELPTR